jgi:predicted DNA repair protein MutK
LKENKMHNTVEPNAQYLDAALNRISAGIEHKKVHKRHKKAAILTGSVLALSLATVGAAAVWPSAKAAPYIVCLQTSDMYGMTASGVGFDMGDPVGYCIDSANFDGATTDAPRVTWAATPRTDLTACKLSTGVAGVFPTQTGDDVCSTLGLTTWTTDDAVTAAQLKDAYDAWQLKEFGLDPATVTVTPSQIVGG